MVEWSYDLLADDERLLFDRLCVFRATFCLEDAEAVVVDDRLALGAVAPAMIRLVRASMVTSAAPGRFRLLDTFRAYGEANLDDLSTWRDRHLDWVRRFATEAATELSGPRQVEWFDRAVELFDDIQAALSWCAERGYAALGFDIASKLFHLWMGRSRRFEGLRWDHGDHPGAVDARRARDRGRRRSRCTGGRRGTRRDRTALAGRDRGSRAAGGALHACPRRTPARSLARVWDLRAWTASHRGDYGAARRHHARGTAELAALERPPPVRRMAEHRR
jgi:hypothetical protein